MIQVTRVHASRRKYPRNRMKEKCHTTIPRKFQAPSVRINKQRTQEKATNVPL